MKSQFFSRAWSSYEIPAQLRDSENPKGKQERRTETSLTWLGPDALDVIDAINGDSTLKTKKGSVDGEMYKLNRECNGTYYGYVFKRRDQETNESVNAYVTALRILAKTGNYGLL